MTFFSPAIYLDPIGEPTVEHPPLLMATPHNEVEPPAPQPSQPNPPPRRQPSPPPKEQEPANLH